MSFSSTNKYDYIEVVNRGVPEFYRVTDYRKYGSEEDVSLTFLGKLIKAAIQNDLLFTVSGHNKLQVAEYFVPGSKTHITPNSFQGKILTPYKLTFDSFANKQEFKDWLSGTFLPDSKLNDPSGFFAQLSGYGSGSFSSLDLTHQYLLDNLGLFYIMNTSSLQGGSASSNGSAIEIDYLADTVYDGKEATEQEALNALFRFFWENRESSTFYKGFIPFGYDLPNSEVSANPGLSGTQLFDAVRVQLETWTDKRLKNHDFYKQSLVAVITNTGPFPSKLREAGPFQRFLKALSLGVADINLILEEIGDLLSIDECPERFLELLANNIGWRLLTGDYTKWRAQLRNAVLMYKTKGSVLGLEAACKLVFPDGVFSASSVVETWESYVPKLLYYMVKNKSFIAKEGLEFEPLDDTFKQGWPSGIRFNQAPKTYADAKDRNYRFLVDSILERFHNQFDAILINGASFKKLPIWTELPDSEPGFFHRNYPKDPKDQTGFFVAVPPWEKYGFYKETELNEEKVNFLCNILSGSRLEGGFEVDEYVVEGFRTLAMTAINTVYTVSGTPQYAENNKFRLFTAGHELPPDYRDFIEYAKTSVVADFDLWSTKGSHLFVAFDADNPSFDFTFDSYDTFRNKAALEAYRDILRDFVPLHAVVRILLYRDLEDSYAPSGTLCVFSEKCLDDFNTELLGSRRTDFWAGASGTGNLGATYVNGDGRILPDYTVGTNDFWNVSADDLDRNASRRRNYRYALGCYPYTRGGKGMPVALNYYDASSSNPYLYSDEYIIKGFEYDRQAFVAPSSTVWDNSAFFSSTACESSKTSGEYQLSTLYPFRAAGDTDYECSSLPVYRDTMKGILEVMTTRSLEEDKFADLTDVNYRNFEFGTSLHRSYSIYKNEFSSVLLNSNIYSRYYGGHNFLSYAFGPTLWNSDFRNKGLITQFSETITAASSVYPLTDPSLGINGQPSLGQEDAIAISGRYEYILQTQLYPSSVVTPVGDIGQNIPVEVSGLLNIRVLMRPRNSDLNFVRPTATALSSAYDVTEAYVLFHGPDVTGPGHVPGTGNCFWTVEGADATFNFSSGNVNQSETNIGIELSSIGPEREVVFSLYSHNYSPTDGSSVVLRSKFTLSGESQAEDSRYGYDAQWRKVIGANRAAGQRYINILGREVAVSQRTYFAEAPTASSTDSGIVYDGSRKKTREYLSGLEIHQPRRNSKSFMVVNDPSATYNTTERGNAVTMFNTDNRPLELVVPFDPATSGSSYYNRLRSQSRFAVDVFARTKQNSVDQKIGISLVTSGVLQDDGEEREWSYHWPSKKWIPTDMVFNPDDLVTTLEVPASDECVNSYRAHFHTQDVFTLKEIPCTSVFKSDDVHASSTAYEIRVSNQTVTDPRQDGLNIYEISVVDTELNQSMNSFNTSAVDRIYTFWDELSEGKYSRDLTNSASDFGTKGGSRAEYLELVGFTDYTTSSTYYDGRFNYDTVEIQVVD